MPCGRKRKPAAFLVTLTMPCGSLARSAESNAVMLSVISFSTAPSGTLSVAPMRLTLAESVGVTGSFICGRRNSRAVTTLAVEVVVSLSILRASAEVATTLSESMAQTSSCETFVVSFAQATKIVAMAMERYLLSLFITLLPYQFIRLLTASTLNSRHPHSNARKCDRNVVKIAIISALCRIQMTLQPVETDFQCCLLT